MIESELSPLISARYRFLTLTEDHRSSELNAGHPEIGGFRSHVRFFCEPQRWDSMLGA
jgi:hypothetical protein